MRRILGILACSVMVPQLAATGQPVDYATQIKPILSARCYSCHSALRQQSGLRLDTAAMLAQGGDSGAAVVPGNSGDSLAVQYITGEIGTRMPPEEDGAPLAPDQIALIRKWIDEGAQAPAEATPPNPRDHWAYQPPLRPALPKVHNATWSNNAVDAFLAASHESRGLTPVTPAPKAVLLRRVYFDLIGLPPTPAEYAAFLADESPDAYLTVVDRLLASPQYGERWGRHWMDVWRYSDWSGYMQEIRDSARHIWHWRDWIVESLNADKPYDRMVHEMLAGDELAPADPNTFRATGYLVRNWNKFNRNTWLEGTIEHTAKAFLGVTMNCCRCHDHKFDPISQEEYFAFRAIFEPHDIRTSRVAGQPDLLQAGVPHVCDLKPDAPTHLLERGNEKRPDTSRSIPPGVPQSLGSKLTVTPIELPISAWYPALADFAIQEDLSSAAQLVTSAEAALTAAQAAVAAAQQQGEAPAEPQKLASAVAAAELAAKKLIAARAAHAALAARVEADRARHGLKLGGDAAALARAAAKAERELALAQAQEQQTAAAQELAAANAVHKPDDAATVAAVTTAQAKVTAAATALAAAHAALAAPAAEYQPLGEQLPRTSTGRRLALARWITDRNNPLAARVAINHIWLRHFGSPLVDNTFDFGLRSPQSRNQPLLDWLAVELMEGGWQMKRIHRLLVTSNAYRMHSTAPLPTKGGPGEGPLANATLDPDNRLLWRMNARRMEAEVVRDSLFYTAGKLDLTRGGPDLACDLAATTPRRSLYFTHAYEKQARFLETFDGASVNECYRRSDSVVPQQALALANSETSRDQARSVAQKIAEQADKTPEPDHAFVQLAFQHVLGREPSTAETGECRAFLLAQAESLKTADKLTPIAGGAKPAIEPATDPAQRARENLTLVLFNHNDFVTIR